MKTYKATIGLEIHAELKTGTKMFCASKNDADEVRPNVNICPVCMGHPGTLPVINKAAVKSVCKVGVAVGGSLASFTEFDRKNYFYPDIPKGYQISQYKYPLVSGGELRGVKITRIHLEEDTATSLHVEDPEHGEGKKGYSLVDFNRAGVPLMELVTEPVIRDAKSAGDFARELQLVLRYLGVSDANMEKGEMRVEANISVSDTDALGVKTEVKNLNSFRVVEKAIAYEIARQTGLLESGEKVVQETRGWDDAKGVTYSQRMKESSHDYRYFPDPDLPKLDLSEIPEFSREALLKEMPELPWAKRERYEKKFGVKKEDIELFIAEPVYAAYFELVAEALEGRASSVKLASNYILTDLAGLSKEGGWKEENLPARIIADIITLIETGELSSRGAKDLIAVYYNEGGALKGKAPKDVAMERGMIQKSDEEALTKIARTLIAENPKVVADYKAGKETSLQFLVGQGMKATKGSANPQMLREIIQKKLTQ